jgi:hydrogenase-4 component E
MQNNLLILLSLLIVLSNIFLLGSSRTGAMIRGIAFQGLMLSLLPLFIPSGEVRILEILILAALSIVVKGVLIPHYLGRVTRNVNIRKELHPYVSYSVSVLFGLLISYASFYFIKKLPFMYLSISPFNTSAAFASIIIGMFIIATRRNIIAQIIGYLVFENGGFILAISIASSQPLFVEIGIMLDLLAGIVIMVVAVNHIHLYFNSVDAESLERLNK